MRDRTVDIENELTGVGLHSGKPSKVIVSRFTNGDNTKPGLYLTDGLYYKSYFTPGTANRITPRSVIDTTLSTEVEINHGGLWPHTLKKVSTVEHLMAALWAYKISSANLYVYGNEIPILDGSSLPWCKLLHLSSVKYTDKQIDPIIIMDTIRIEHGDSFLEIAPYNGFKVDITIDFPYKSIGRRRYISELTPSIFKEELACCRTFVHVDDVVQLKMMGKALGGSFDNAIVVDDKKVLNPDGLRTKDEFVKHKVLDLIGDLWTLGRPIQGMITGYKPGHKINNMLARRLYSAYVKIAEKDEVVYV